MRTFKNSETTKESIQGFLSQKTIAVVGVSERRETGCNANFKKFKDQGYYVYAVNPHLSSYNNEPCYPDLAAIPAKPDAVFIMTNPLVTESIVKQCVDLGIKYVWMHCMFGTKPGLMKKATSVSLAAVAYARANGITVIPGTCPNQFLAPDGAHGFMRRIFTWLGFLK